MARAAAKKKPADIAGKFTADEVVMRNVDDLKPFPNNPKVHTPEQIEAIAANMREFGFDQPILVDEHDTILKGHGRQLASRKVPFDQVPTICRPGLSLAQKWAIVISDNALPALTGFDKALLRIGVTTLAKLDYPLRLTGLDGIRLATFMGAAPATGSNPDEQPEPEAKSISRKGETWLLGDHVLKCADCTKVKLDEKPRLQLTDPPYELETEGGGMLAKRAYPKKMLAAGVDKFDVAEVELHGRTNVFFTSKALVPAYLNRAEALKVVWDLNVMHRGAAMPNTAGHLMTDLDYIVVMGNMGPERGLELANYSKMLSLGHWERPVPWAKPVQVLTKYIRLFSCANDLVFDPYCGSGTTIIACAMEGRRCLGIEINPVFVDLSIRRWEKFAGKKAILSGTKKTFDQVSKERAKA